MNARKLLERKSLIGLEGVSVVIEDISPQAEAEWPTKRELKQNIELKLQKAGIQILPEEAGSACLCVNINIMKTCIGAYLYITRVALRPEPVQPHERPGESYLSTWKVTQIGVMEINSLQKIFETMCNQIDKFIRDYRAANQTPSVAASSYVDILAKHQSV